MEQQPGRSQKASTSDFADTRSASASGPQSTEAFDGGEATGTGGASGGPKPFAAGDDVGDRRTLAGLAASPFLWGGLVTVAFYGMVTIEA